MAVFLIPMLLTSACAISCLSSKVRLLRVVLYALLIRCAEYWQALFSTLRRLLIAPMR